MSYSCDLVIPINEIPGNKLKIELYDLLLDFRPEDSGLIDCDGFVLEFPSDFRDDPTGALSDFMKKHKLTINVDFIDEFSNTTEIVYVDGVEKDD
jgi:hypothetical protein